VVIDPGGGPRPGVGIPLAGAIHDRASEAAIDRHAVGHADIHAGILLVGQIDRAMGCDEIDIDVETGRASVTR
jgi:hypothetical protein